MLAAFYQKIKWFLPAIIWAALILVASSIPGQDLPKQEIPHLDKLVHLGLYGILGFLIGLRRIPFYYSLLLAALFGLCDELYQLQTPGRSMDPMDWLCDILGAALGIYICQWILKKRDERL
ncbi:MAG: VanZ family protein [Blastochloris sp.]|nr:VanZ family protein [Blastochloris sp.]